MGAGWAGTKGPNAIDGSRAAGSGYSVARVLRCGNFFVYVIDNVREGDPAKFGLKVLGGDWFARLMERAKERRYFEVRVPVAEYDSAPGREALADLP
jgi:hypothetical protein